MPEDPGNKQQQGEASAPSFSAEAMAEYEAILAHYPVRRAALMGVLWLAQREFGWLSPEVQAYVARLMDIPLGWLEGVVSFYSMYYTRPMGRHHIQVCTNLSCRLRGADAIVSAIRRRLGIKPGETTRDMRFSLDTVECLASCDTAPMLQLGDRYVENLDVPSTLELIGRLETEV